MENIQWLHFICFILLVLAKWADRTSLHGHFTVYLQIASLAVYMVLTFYCIDIGMILNDIRYFECTNLNKGDLGYAH